jgi:hypothetical protein
MVQHALALVRGFGGPAKLGSPPRLGPVLLLTLVSLPVHEGFPVFALGNLNGAGLGGGGKVDIGLGTVVDIGRDRYAFWPAVKAFGNCLFVG